MSGKSPRSHRSISDGLSAVVHPSAGSQQQTYSRTSTANHLNNKYSRSHSSSGQVVLDIGNKWTSSSNIAVVSRFWRNTIAIVTAPFILTGAPVLSAIFSTKADDSLEPIDTTIKWLKTIFTNVMLLPFNILALVIALALNGWLSWIVLDIMYQLFILGQVPKYLWDAIFDSIDIIPIILTVDLFWLKGYRIKDVISNLDFDLITVRQINAINIVLKLIVLINICISLHIVGYFTFEWRLKFGYTYETRLEYLAHLPHRVIMTLLIPVYITFASAIHFKYKQMNDFMKQLVNTSEAPEIVHLREIKMLFKTNAGLIARVNAGFNLVMTTFFAIILIGTLRDFNYIFYSILAYVSFARSGAEGGPELQESHVMSEMVRCIAADVLVTGMKLALIGATVLQILSVNYESRATPIHLNDMFSQFDHIIQPVLYRSYRLLKYYMKSRLEKTDRPALLNITLLSNIPLLRARLTARTGY